MYIYSDNLKSKAVTWSRTYSRAKKEYILGAVTGEKFLKIISPENPK